ncbi:HNH endonuclease [Microbacterium aerolatum]|uniref:HNH endonuclease signature motif containing protein n=1 Tax=Microbacterium aerolatum TaxID=153731 RepID=UPI002001282E|nr:HNH endonuclease signature motif containing protein [Microbacterium aerolatum]MCK3768703.1 HNH endonuclease [Microbacterium aerolatum]
MTSLVHELKSIDRRLADAMASSTAHGGVRLASDGELVETLQVLGRIQRRLDGAITETTDRVVERDQCERAARLTTQVGCRDASDLLRRVLCVDGYSARRYVTAAAGTHRDLDITSGALLPARYPELAAALLGGEVSLSGFLACVTPLQKHARLGVAERLSADAVLARLATGRPLDGAEDTSADMDESPEIDPDEQRAPVPTTDELAGLAAHIINRLDPDGAEPTDRAAKRRRHLTIGRLRDGSVPVRGELLPEVAAQLQKLIDSLLNPRVDPDAPVCGTVQFRPSDETPTADGASDAAVAGAARADGVPPHRVESPPLEVADLRTRAQKRHDAFATILGVAAASGGMPRTGGAAPTLVVSITASDFAIGTGRATIEGPGYDVPFGVAAHAGCAGGVQRVLFDDNGAIIAIGTSARIFNAHQRRAIVLRDRNCLIPGCDIPAEWCEIHHVTEHSRGGPTHTDNGVPLCWHHHRALDQGHWYIRMRNGRPEIRGPNWWDPWALWRSPHLDYAAVDQALDTGREREPAWGSW